MTSLEQMIELWRGIAQLHRSDALCQTTLRAKVQQQSLAIIADSIAAMVSSYNLALAESDLPAAANDC